MLPIRRSDPACHGATLTSVGLKFYSGEGSKFKDGRTDWNESDMASAAGLAFADGVPGVYPSNAGL